MSYLNSKPLIEGLTAQLPGGLLLDVPSRLAAGLAAGALDVALVPSIEVLRSGGRYEPVSDACVAARGPVRSVKVYFRVPPAAVRTLALDEGSRTSATLARVLLAHKYGVTPQTTTLPLTASGGNTPLGPDAPLAATAADAVLLIGDRAMLPATGSFAAVWDLGEEWFAWTGLPFVFAHWAGRRGAVPQGLADLLQAARNAGVAAMDQIAGREAAAMHLDPTLVNEYLRMNLHFTLGSPERAALRLFTTLARDAGLCPQENEHDICDLESTDIPSPASNGTACRRSPSIADRDAVGHLTAAR